MKVETPQILWHPEDDKGLNAALYSVALVQSGFVEDENGNKVPSYVLATAGNDKEIHLWKVVWAEANADDPPVVCGGRPTQIDFLCQLSRHEGAVNCVKFSPDGLTLATAGDTGSVILWSVPMDKRGNGNGQHYWSSVTNDKDLQVRVLSRNMDAVTDLSWSKDSQRLLAGAIDHTIFVCQAAPNGNWQTIYQTKEHQHYVQGVAYDPLGVYFASMSNDRSVRIYTRKPPSKSKKKVQRKDAKTQGPLPTPAFTAQVQQILNEARLEMQMRTKQIKYSKQQTGDVVVKQALFSDETTLQSFFRRLDWTPDGAFLVLPACLWHKPTVAAPLDNAPVNKLSEAPAHSVCLFARHQWEEPYRVLTGLEKPAVAIACNPVLFTLPTTDQENQPRCAKVPYRCIMAVLTHDSVLIYDTIHSTPLAVMRGLHYANLTNAVWSADGRSLVVSSSDGYVSLVRFGPGELGTDYKRPVEETPVPEASPLSAPRSVKPASTPRAIPQEILPPCEPGTTTVLEGRPAKKAKRITPTCIKRKTEELTVPSVQDLSLVEPKKKKRIQPVLMSASLDG